MPVTEWIFLLLENGSIDFLFELSLYVVHMANNFYFLLFISRK